MSPRLLLILSLFLAGCATGSGDTPPVCDGRNRRPANPYGSILVSSPTPVSPPAPSAVGSDPARPDSGGCA